MRISLVIPTYWGRAKAEGWKVGDAVYDHPTYLDEEGTLGKTLETNRSQTAGRALLSNQGWGLAFPANPFLLRVSARFSRPVVAKSVSTKRGR